jgi:hypothetical protein
MSSGSLHGPFSTGFRLYDAIADVPLCPGYDSPPNRQNSKGTVVAPGNGLLGASKLDCRLENTNSMEKLRLLVGT